MAVDRANIYITINNVLAAGLPLGAKPVPDARMRLDSLLPVSGAPAWSTCQLLWARPHDARQVLVSGPLLRLIEEAVECCRHVSWVTPSTVEGICGPEAHADAGEALVDDCVCVACDKNDTFMYQKCSN